MKTYSIFILIVLLSLNSCKLRAANGESAECNITDQQGRILPFIPSEKPLFDLKNGHLSVFIAGKDQTMIQINDINNANAVRVLYIRSQGDTLFESNPALSPVKLRVRNKVMKAGEPINLRVRSKLYYRELIYTIDARIIGYIPVASDEQTH